jgi:hypothetical protein
MKYFTVILLVALWAFIFWMIDVHGVQVLLRQHASESFPGTQGTVLHSSVTTTRGSKGSIHYHVSISYQYVVDGQTYVGRRYRYDGHPGNEEVVNAVVDSHPAGSAVEVYYNPRDPWDTVLSTAVDAQDVYILFLFTPVSLVFLWALMNAIQQIDWPGSSQAVAGGVKLISEIRYTRVRLPRHQPLMLGLAALGALSLLAGILMAAGAVSGPPLTVGAELLAGMLLGGGLVFGWFFQQVQSGRQDLVIDEGARTVQLPLTYKRREQSPVPFSEIKQVAMKMVRHKTKRGVYYTYLVTLEMTDGSLQDLLNTKQSRAEPFAAWLIEKFGLSGTAPVLNPEA